MIVAKIFIGLIIGFFVLVSIAKDKFISKDEKVRKKENYQKHDFRTYGRFGAHKNNSDKTHG
mgnify:CR=1 FL=1